MATNSSRSPPSSSRAETPKRFAFLGIRLPTKKQTSRNITPDEGLATPPPHPSNRRFPLPLPYSATVEFDRMLGDTRSSSATTSIGGQMPYVGRGGQIWRDQEEELEYARLLQSSSSSSDTDESGGGTHGQSQATSNTRRGRHRRNATDGQNVNRRGEFQPVDSSAPTTIPPQSPPLAETQQALVPNLRHDARSVSPRQKRLSPAPDLSLSNPAFLPPPPTRAASSGYGEQVSGQK